MNTNIPEALKYLRAKKGITQADLAKALGVGKSTISMYEVGAREPDFEMLENIADYFNVDMMFLVRPNAAAKEKAPTLTKKDERDIARDLEAIMAELEAGGDMMFDGDPMTPEARESIMSAMRLGLEAAKAKNKERFTPHKYRKE
jgi:transcriptional regulator with XRE-family HTH domain